MGESARSCDNDGLAIGVRDRGRRRGRCPDKASERITARPRRGWRAGCAWPRMLVLERLWVQLNRARAHRSQARHTPVTTLTSNAGCRSCRASAASSVGTSWGPVRAISGFNELSHAPESLDESRQIVRIARTERFTRWKSRVRLQRTCWPHKYGRTLGHPEILGCSCGPGNVAYGRESHHISCAPAMSSDSKDSGHNEAAGAALNCTALKCPYK